MIFKRKIYHNMLDWKWKREGKTALLIEGARRVGKSTIAEEFGRNEYKSYVLVDFSKADTRLKNIFRNHLTDLDEFFQLFQAETNTRLIHGSKTNFKINPIEVKSSKNYTTTSLTDFKEKYKKRILHPYVIHPKNFKEENEIKYLPVYMTYLL